MPRNVSVKSGCLKYAQTISAGPHQVHADEPTDQGGSDTGPDPEELLMASLGSCMNITMQMYALKHGWPLAGVKTVLSYARLPAPNPIDSDKKSRMVDRIEVEIVLTGNLAEEQEHRLVEIAGRCPVHRMLAPQVQIETKLCVYGHRQ